MNNHIINQSFNACNSTTTPIETKKLQMFGHSPLTGCPINKNVDNSNASSIDSACLISNFKTNLTNGFAKLPKTTSYPYKNISEINTKIDSTCSEKSKTELANPTDLNIDACDYKFIPNISKYDACIINELQSDAQAMQLEIDKLSGSTKKYFYIGGGIIIAIFIGLGIWYFISKRKTSTSSNTNSDISDISDTSTTSTTSSESSNQMSIKFSNTEPKTNVYDKYVGGENVEVINLESRKTFWCLMIILSILFLLALQFK
jgi:hypothetical protein